MKRLILLLLALAIIALSAGCRQAAPAEDGAAMQMASDLSEAARECADRLFLAHMKEQGVQQYEIAETARGFITDDPIVFIVGYRYTAEDSEGCYGYKLSWNENQTFTVLDEGISVGESVFS